MSDIISQMGSLAEAFLPKHAAKLSNYLYKGPKTGLPGAPKKYDGKVDVDKLCL